VPSAVRLLTGGSQQMPVECAMLVGRLIELHDTRPGLFREAVYLVNRFLGCKPDACPTEGAR
jgi:hypothetical protein